MEATIKDVQRIHDTTIQFRALNGRLIDVFVRETMGVFEVGGLVGDKFHKSSLFKRVCFSLKELGEYIAKIKRHKSFITKPSKKTKIRTF